MARKMSAVLAIAVCVTVPVWGQAPPGSLPPPPPPFVDPSAGGQPSPLLPVAPVQVPQPYFPTPIPNSPPPPVVMVQPLQVAVYPPGPYRSPFAQAPGWFAGLELGAVVPTLHDNLSGSVNIGGVNTPVNVPGADLDWTGSIRLELGYRFPDDVGAIVGAFRYLSTEGGGTVTGFDAAGDGTLQTHLSMDVVDLDYVSSGLSLAPWWDLQWRVGGRFASVYFASQVQGQLNFERSMNQFIGAGPHFGVEVHRALDMIPGLSAYGRLEGAVLFGGVTQSFTDTQTQPDGSVLGGSSQQSGALTVPVLGFETGLAFTPTPSQPWINFTLGYQIEQWWGLGNLQSSSASLTVQGLFFRGVFHF